VQVWMEMVGVAVGKVGLHQYALEHQARVARPTNDHHNRDECRFQ